MSAADSGRVAPCTDDATFRGGLGSELRFLWASMPRRGFRRPGLESWSLRAPSDYFLPLGPSLPTSHALDRTTGGRLLSVGIRHDGVGR